MIFDSFIFFDELELLDIRLHELDPVVDYFVLVESNYTFSGLPKKLYFSENKNKFSSFLKKIRLVVIDSKNPPLYTSQKPLLDNELFQKNSLYWNREFMQRNACLEALSDAQPNDIILIGDADEIPKPHLLKNISLSSKPLSLQFDVFYYYLNCFSHQVNYCTRAITYQKLLQTSPHLVRLLKPEDCQIIKKAGWHFSYLGNLKKIRTKINSFSHQELNTTQYNDLKRLEFNIKNNFDLYDRSIIYQTLSINSSFPQYIYKNQKKFSRLIKKKDLLDKNTRLLRQEVIKCRQIIANLNHQIADLNQKFNELKLTVEYQQSQLKIIKTSKTYKLWQLFKKLHPT